MSDRKSATEEITTAYIELFKVQIRMHVYAMRARDTRDISRCGKFWKEGGRGGIGSWARLRMIGAAPGNNSQEIT